MTFPTTADNAWRPSSLLGREALLRLLGTRLITETRLLIGVDPALQCRIGVGRTRLISELVGRVTPQYTHVVSLCGLSPATWQASLRQTARQLQIRQTSFRRASDLAAAIRGWLGSHENWLLVVDNVADLDDLKEITEGVHSGHWIAILNDAASVTSSDWPAAVPLGSLSTEDALKVLQAAIGREWRNTDEVVTATHIVNHLERNPLGVELAGRGIWLTGLDLLEYWQQLSSLSGSTPILSVLKLLLAKIENHQPAAMTLLASGVALGPAPIPTAIFQAIAGRLCDENTSLQLLTDCGLLRSIDRGEFFTIPAVVELSTLLSPATQRLGTKLVQSTLPTRVVRSRLREHVCGESDIEQDPLAIQRIWLGQSAAAAENLDSDQISVIRQAADAALDLLLPKIAVKLLGRTLDHAIASAGNDSELLQPLVELGAAYVLSEQFQPGRKRWRQAMEVCSTEHPLQTELLLAIAEIDVNENRLDRAVGRLTRVSSNCNAQPPSAHNQLLAGQLNS